MGVPIGLDFNAVMAVGHARGVDLTLLTETLPAAEAGILAGREGVIAFPDEEE